MKITLGAAQFGSNYGITNKKKLLLKEVKKILNFSKKKNSYYRYSYRIQKSK